jgi:hypothetical protein
MTLHPPPTRPAPAPRADGQVTPSSIDPRPPVCGLRIHSREPIGVEWLARTAVPLWERLRGGGRHLVALRRGWLGGPHAEAVVVGGAAEIDVAALRRQVHVPAPTGPEMTGAQYLDTARERGRLENVAPPYLPFRAHGEVRLVRRDPGTTSAQDLKAVVEAVLSPAAVAGISEADGRPDRIPTLLVGVLAQVAATHALGAGYGTFSLRSHAEAVLASQPPGRDLRPRFDRLRAEQGGQIRDVVGDVLGHRSRGSVAQWGERLAYAGGVLDTTVRSGGLTDADIDAHAHRATDQGRPGPDATTAAGGDHPDTDFHRRVYGSGRTEEAGPWFAGYRLLVNAVYSMLPLLDVTPIHRIYACLAVAEAVDELLGQSWTERLEEVDR